MRVSIRKKLPFLVCIILFSCSSTDLKRTPSSLIHFNHSCATESVKLLSNDFIWNTITDRSLKDLQRALMDDSENGINGKMKLFDSNIISITKGEKSLLSLGEGKSNFIKMLIEQAQFKRQIDTIDNIQAVDIIFDQPANHFSRNNPTFKFIMENRANYHGSTFQKLSQLSHIGGVDKFDEIISSWSLNFVLDEQPETIIPIIENFLKKGGYLRIFPIDSETVYKNKLLPILNSLLDKEIISNFTKMTDQDQVLTILK